MRRAILIIAVLTVIGFAEGVNAQPPFTPPGPPVTPPPGGQARTAIVQTLYGYLPSRVLETGSTAPDSLFSPNVQGRVTPLGGANDLATVKDYFFGLNNIIFSGPVSSFTFNSLVAVNDQVFVDVDINFAQLPVPGSVQPPTLHQIGFFRFNSANQIVSFDLTIPRLGAALGSEGVDLTNPNARSDFIFRACATALGAPGAGNTARCTPTVNTAYVDFQDCVNSMATKPLGTFDWLNPDTITCRAARAPFITLLNNPNRYCPILNPVSPVCNDTAYSNYFLQRY
jgi:hypothetical protein